MTAKRFTTDYEDFLKEDMTFIKNNDKRMTFQEVVNLLNELYEENQRLKKENAELEKFRYSIFKRMGELYEEQ